MSTTDGFFAVDRRAWERVYDLGLAAALAYLVMARGTGGDNRTTKWSVSAIEKYTGMRRSRSAAAVADLIESELVREKGSALPGYYLAPAEPDAEPDWIWLSNTITDGAKDETPPVQLLRQTKNPAALRLFIDLHHAQNLADMAAFPGSCFIGATPAKRSARAVNGWSSAFSRMVSRLGRPPRLSSRI